MCITTPWVSWSYSRMNIEDQQGLYNTKCALWHTPYMPLLPIEFTTFVAHHVISLTSPTIENPNTEQMYSVDWSLQLPVLFNYPCDSLSDTPVCDILNDISSHYSSLQILPDLQEFPIFYFKKVSNIEPHSKGTGP